MKSGILLAPIVAIGCLWATIACGATAAPDAFRHWAIIASEDLQQDGFSDLLTIEMSRSKDISLVEREKVAKVIEELKLSAATGATSAFDRVKLGRLVKADALVLVMLSNRGKKSYVNVVVSDCLYGVRLHTESLPYEAKSHERSARDVARIVEQTRRRFAGGIRQIIGIPHFLSKNLYQYDHCQAGYANLVANVLIAVPGVAVIETEEAQSISRELLLSGNGLKDRLVPMFINGEFEMRPPDQGKELSVHISIRLVDGKRTLREIDRKDLSATQVAELLTVELPRLALELANIGEGRSISRDEQVRLLLARADAFAELSEWEHSTGLREAALLLQPDNVKLRAQTFQEYIKWLDARRKAWAKKPYGLLPEKELNAWITDRNEQIPIWRSSLSHAVMLVDSRKFAPSETAILVNPVFFTDRFERPGAEMPSGVEEMRDEFYWHVVTEWSSQTLAFAKEKARNSSARQVGGSWWIDFAVQCLFDMQRKTVWTGDKLQFRQSRIDNRRVFNDFYRLLTEVIPQDGGPASAVVECLNGTCGLRNDFLEERTVTLPQTGKTVVIGGVSQDGLRRCCQRLIDSGKPVNIYYGRLGLFSLLDYKNHEDWMLGKSDETAVEKRFAEAKELLAMAQRYGWKEQCEYWAQFIPKLAGKSGKSPWDPRHPMPTGGRGVTVRTEDIPPHKPVIAGRLSYEWVASRWPSSETLRKCSDSMDMLFYSHRIYLMTTKGTWNEVFRADKESSQIADVQWDGKQLWIATNEQGILVMSPDGSIVDRIGEKDGLPPYDSGWIGRSLPRPSWRARLQLHPVEPGKCLVLGAFGPSPRRWAAVVSRNTDIPEAPGRRVHVFYRAMKVSKEDAQSSDDDLDAVSDMGWTKEYPSRSSPGQRLLLVGRDRRQCPLAIDLGTLQVRPFVASKVLSDPQLDQHHLLVCANGNILIAECQNNRLQVRVLRPPKVGVNESWTDTVLFEDASPPPPHRNFNTALLAYKDKVLYMGLNWYYIDPETLTHERLANVPLPSEFHETPFYPSAHYGLVTTGKNWHVSRVSIADTVRSGAPEGDTHELKQK